MPGGAAIAGLQGIPDPLASLPAATRMALGATAPASPGPEGMPVVAALAGAPNPSALGALADHGIGAAAADDGAVAGAAGRAGAPAGTPRSADESASSEGAGSGPVAGSARARATGSAQGDAAESGATDLGLVPGRATEPMPAPTAPAPLAGGVPATMDAAALVARLIGQVPLSGSADDAIRMLFPAGSGPIEQIVLNREAGQLNLVVSATPSAREAVSRSVLDLERRLRDRGLPVGAVRLSEREAGH
ncbi:MAG: hypothetical protein KGQ67_12485 [Betaproteobacteria bacterium]|nr:hypothetical protein [Betaproteobacteria bacterium]